MVKAGSRSVTAPYVIEKKLYQMKDDILRKIDFLFQQIFEKF